MAFSEPLNVKMYRMKGSPLSGVCPWELSIAGGVVLLKGGALCSAYEYVAPDIGSVTEAKIASVAAQFNNTVAQLGTGWTVQFELQRKLNNDYPRGRFTKLAGQLVENDRARNFTQMKTASFYTNRYFLIFTKELESEIESKSASLFYKSEEVSDKESKNIEMIRGQIQDFITTTDKSVAMLQTVMGVRRLDSDELFSLCHASVSLDWGRRFLPKDWMMLWDRAVTECDLETSMPMKLGTSYIPVITVKSFPSETFPAMFDLLNKADCQLRWSTRFMCLSREDASKRIDAAVKRFHAARKSLGQMILESFAHIESDRVDSAALQQEADANSAKAELYSGSIGFGDYVSNVMVFDEDLDVAEEKAKYIMGLIQGIGFSAKEETHNALQAFLSMQPGNIYANARSLFMSTTNLSHVVPSSSIWSGLYRNDFLGEICGTSLPHLVCGTEFGIPYFLNLNLKDVGHTWISGPTGAGKSTLLGLLEVQFLKYPGAQVIIFDKDRSARGLTMAVGGSYLEPGADETTFQPLAQIDSPDDQRWAVDFIEALLAEQKVDLTPAIRKAVYDCIKLMASKDVSTRDLTSFCQYVNYQDPVTHFNDIKAAIEVYTVTGQYGNIFDSRESHVPITDWTMIEMGALMNMSSAAVTPALLFLFRECEKRFTGRPTLLVLDEAWLFLKNPVFARKLVDWLKTLRKKHVFVVFATQEVADAADSPIGKTIIQQCASKIYLPDDQATTGALVASYRAFGLEDSEIALLANTARMLKKRDYMYKSAQGTRVFQLNLDRLQLGVITTSAEDHAILDTLEQRFGRNSGRELVTQILDAKNIVYKDLLPGPKPGRPVPVRRAG